MLAVRRTDGELGPEVRGPGKFSMCWVCRASIGDADGDADAAGIVYQRVYRERVGHAALGAAGLQRFYRA